MPSSTVAKNFRDGLLEVFDGTGSPISMPATLETGDFSLSGRTSGQKETSVYLDRGDFATIRHTNQAFPTVSLSAHMAYLSDGSAGSFVDLIRKTGQFASAVSTLGANAELMAYRLILTIEGTDHGDSADHQISLDDVVLSVDFSEGDPNSFSLSGTVYGAIALT